MNIAAPPEITGRKAGNATGAEPLALRVNDACRALSISRSHLYSLASKGEIRLLHIGGRTLVPRSEIARLVGEDAE